MNTRHSSALEARHIRTHRRLGGLWSVCKIMKACRASIMILILLMVYSPGCRKPPPAGPVSFRTTPSPSSQQSGELLLDDLEDTCGDMTETLIKLFARDKLLREEDLTEAALRKARKRADEIDATLKFGNILISRNDLQGAFRTFATLSEKYPDNVKAICSKGMVRFFQGDFEGGKSLMERAVRIAPKSPEPFIAMGEVWMQYWNFPDAHRAFQRALSLNQANPYLYTSYGDLLCAMEDIAGAEEMYRKALKYAPKEPIVKEKLAAIYVMRNDMQQGLHLLEEARSLSTKDPLLLFKQLLLMDPREAEALCTRELTGKSLPSRDLFYLAKAQLLIREKKYDSAEKLLASSPAAETSTAKTLLAVIELKKKNYKKAIARLSGLIKSDPFNDRLYALRAIGYFRGHDMPHALVDCGKAMDLRPGSSLSQNLNRTLFAPLANLNGPELLDVIEKNEKALSTAQDKAPIYYLLSEIRIITGDKKKALSYYGKGVQAGGSDNFYLRKMAGFYLSNNKPNEAKVILGEALRRDPGDPLAVCQMALIHIREGKFAKAIQQIDAVPDMLIWDAQAHYLKGTAYSSNKDYYKALQELRNALILDPSLHDAVMMMASVYEHLKKPEAALVLYQKYLAQKSSQSDASDPRLAMIRKKIERLEAISKEK